MPDLQRAVGNIVGHGAADQPHEQHCIEGWQRQVFEVGVNKLQRKGNQNHRHDGKGKGQRYDRQAPGTAQCRINQPVAKAHTHHEPNRRHAKGDDNAEQEDLHAKTAQVS